MVVAPQPLIITKARSPAFSSRFLHSASATVAALAVLARADLHEIGFAQIAEAHPVLGMGGVGGLHRDRGHAVRVALGDFRHLVQALALPGRGGGDVVQGHGPGQSPLVVLAVGVILDLLSGDYLADVQPRFFGQLHGLLARQLIPGVVQRQQQDPVALIRQLHGIEDQLAVGGGKDIAYSLHVQHALPHETCLGGLVTGAAVGDDGNPVGVFQIVADDQMAFYFQDIRISQAQAREFLVCNGLRRVDELLHLHRISSSMLLGFRLY